MMKMMKMMIYSINLTNDAKETEARIISNMCLDPISNKFDSTDIHGRVNIEILNLNYAIVEILIWDY